MAKVHVVPRPDGWAVKNEGASRAFRVFDTKDEALKEALSYARETGGSVIVHGRDNKIQRIITPKEIEKGGDCFLTTACVNYFKFDDNCFELETLRNFRDKKLSQTPEGQNLIKQYNQIAPIIVNEIKNDSQKDIIFQFILEEIRSACKAIDKKDYCKATNIYKEAVITLTIHYNLLLA